MTQTRCDIGDSGLKSAIDALKRSLEVLDLLVLVGRIVLDPRDLFGRVVIEWSNVTDLPSHLELELSSFLDQGFPPTITFSSVLLSIGLGRSFDSKL